MKVFQKIFKEKITQAQPNCNTSNIANWNETPQTAEAIMLYRAAENHFINFIIGREIPNSRGFRSRLNFCIYTSKKAY